MKLVDSIKIKVKAGDGGDGIVSFRTAKGRAFLGPDGGSGGIGGSVYLVADRGLNSLGYLRFGQILVAKDGVKGGVNNRAGACGEHKLIPVPLGTVAFDAETGVELGELVEHGAKLLIAEGGKRGRGNLSFVSSTNRAPRQWSPGGEGEEKALRLELKLIADIGLSGFPNAGKSSLLRSVSAARPKVAEYPFTTLEPHLGVVDLHMYGHYGDSFVLADIPGLIEGASRGRGLGHKFLRHLERTRLIAYVIELDPYAEPELGLMQLQQLQRELEAYDEAIAAKAKLIILTKIDLLPEGEDLSRYTKPFEKLAYPVLTVSSFAGAGVKDLSLRLFKELQTVV